MSATRRLVRVKGLSKGGDLSNTYRKGGRNAVKGIFNQLSNRQVRSRLNNDRYTEVRAGVAFKDVFGPKGQRFLQLGDEGIRHAVCIFPISSLRSRGGNYENDMSHRLIR